MLLVHGLGGGPYEVQRLAEQLTRELGLTTQVVLLPGHGGAGLDMPASTWPEWCSAVEGAFTALAREHSCVDAVGFSTGAPILLKLAAQRRLGDARLVLLAPLMRVFRPSLFPIAPERLLEGTRFLERIPRRPPPLRDRAVRDEVLRCSHHRLFNLTAARSALELIRQVRAELPGLRAPTLVIQGRGDTIVSPEAAHELYQSLPEPKRFVWEEDSDHLLCLDRGAERVAAEVVRFLAPPR